MTDHLPECPVDVTVDYRVDCICPALRACEQRVREDERRKWSVHQDRLLTVRTDAYEQGLQAARAAVADVAIRKLWPEEPITDALAAIDALAGES